MSRPLIGVTGPDKRFPIAWWFIRWAVWRAGGQPLRITPGRPLGDRQLDGVIISGGDDIDPGLYLPGDEDPDVAPMDPERDAMETAILQAELERGIPILGICRGAQLLNVVLGGNLHRDLRPLRRKTNNRRTPLARKTLRVSPGTRLHQLLGRDQARINSLHHQAIDRLGDGLVVAGRDLDDFVQAVENPDHRFLIGVQWHPEYLPLRAEQRALFRALCAAAGA